MSLCDMSPVPGHETSEQKVIMKAEDEQIKSPKQESSAGEAAGANAVQEGEEEATGSGSVLPVVGSLLSSPELNSSTSTIGDTNHPGEGEEASSILLPPLIEMPCDPNLGNEMLQNLPKDTGISFPDVSAQTLDCVADKDQDNDHHHHNSQIMILNNDHNPNCLLNPNDSNIVSKDDPLRTPPRPMIEDRTSVTDQLMIPAPVAATNPPPVVTVSINDQQSSDSNCNHNSISDNNLHHSSSSSKDEIRSKDTNDILMNSDSIKLEPESTVTMTEAATNRQLDQLDQKIAQIKCDNVQSSISPGLSSSNLGLRSLSPNPGLSSSSRTNFEPPSRAAMYNYRSPAVSGPYGHVGNHYIPSRVNFLEPPYLSTQSTSSLSSHLHHSSSSSSSQIQPLMYHSRHDQSLYQEPNVLHHHHPHHSSSLSQRPSYLYQYDRNHHSHHLGHSGDEDEDRNQHNHHHAVISNNRGDQDGDSSSPDLAIDLALNPNSRGGHNVNNVTRIAGGHNVTNGIYHQNPNSGFPNSNLAGSSNPNVNNNNSGSTTFQQSSNSGFNNSTSSHSCLPQVTLSSSPSPSSSSWNHPHHSLQRASFATPTSIPVSVVTSLSEIKKRQLQTMLGNHHSSLSNSGIDNNLPMYNSFGTHSNAGGSTSNFMDQNKDQNNSHLNLQSRLTQAKPLTHLPSSVIMTGTRSSSRANVGPTGELEGGAGGDISLQVQLLQNQVMCDQQDRNQMKLSSLSSPSSLVTHETINHHHQRTLNRNNNNSALKTPSGRNVNSQSSLSDLPPLTSGNPNKPFQCPICAKELASKNVYHLHLRMHSGEKPFTCNLCGNAFSQKTSLTRHMRSHTGERPYPCNICHKRFADKERIKIHMRTHTGEKPFICEICDKKFSQKSTVKRHMSVHTGAKPFKCPQCNKAFANRGNQAAHLKTHSSGGSTSHPHSSSNAIINPGHSSNAMSSQPTLNIFQDNNLASRFKHTNSTNSSPRSNLKIADLDNNLDRNLQIVVDPNNNNVRHPSGSSLSSSSGHSTVSTNERNILLDRNLDRILDNNSQSNYNYNVSATSADYKIRAQSDINDINNHSSECMSDAPPILGSSPSP